MEDPIPSNTTNALRLKKVALALCCCCSNWLYLWISLVFLQLVNISATAKKTIWEITQLLLLLDFTWGRNPEHETVATPRVLDIGKNLLEHVENLHADFHAEPLVQSFLLPTTSSHTAFRLFICFTTWREPQRREREASCKDRAMLVPLYRRRVLYMSC